MDKTRKTLKHKAYCNFCIHYQPIMKDGIKTSKGVCRVTGTVKQRTDKCNSRFIDKGQISLI